MKQYVNTLVITAIAVILIIILKLKEKIQGVVKNAAYIQSKLDEIDSKIGRQKPSENYLEINDAGQAVDANGNAPTDDGYARLCTRVDDPFPQKKYKQA